MKKAITARYRIVVGCLRDGAPLWRWLIGAVILLLLPYFVPAPEAILGRPFGLADRLRWAGMLFQFAGLYAVIHGLNEARQLFNRPSIWAAAFGWVARLRYVFASPKAAVGSASARLGAVIGSGVGYARPAIGQGTLDKRVSQLEEAIRAVEQHLAGTDRRIETMRSESRQNEERERNERIAADQKVERQLEQAMIGGITLEAGGIAYLFVGIMLTSIPEEAARLLRHFGL